jgi:hypothetical protein
MFMTAQTYRQLQLSLNFIDEDHLDDNITIYQDDEYVQKGFSLFFQVGDDVLDDGHPYFLTTSEEEED